MAVKTKMSNLEKDAKAFSARRKGTRAPKEKALTARVYLAGQAMSGLLSSAKGPIDTRYLKEESYKIADSFLED